MLIPAEKINMAKAKYDGQAIAEIVRHFGLEDSYNDKDKSCSCPWHRDRTPSFLWNEKTNCFHCFAKETEVITKKGICQIGDIVGQKVEIINGNGQWEKVIFKSYGIQSLLKLNLTSNGVKKTIYATPEHEWIVQGKQHKVQTKDLKQGYRLERMWHKNFNNITPDLGYMVESVEITDRIEEVYCCVTSTHSFVLKDFILTGNCFSCGRNFGIIDLYLEQGMTYLEAVEKLFKQVDMDYSFNQKGVLTSPSYNYPHHEHSDRTKVEQYLQTRKISLKTMDYADVQSDKNGNVVFHYYDSNDVLMTVKYRLGRKFEKGIDKVKCWSQVGADFSPLLFNMNRTDPAQPLVITEGEIDTLSVIESGYKNVVSIPNGCANMKWIEYNYEWLEQFDKIILWFDNDEPGIKARNDAIYRLGTWRTYYIEIGADDLTPNGAKIKDANQLLYFKGADRVLSYINKPFEVPVENVTDLSKAEDFNIEQAEGLYTGIKELDDKIYKLTFGTLNIITGKSGEGKSVFVNQVAICQALQQGYEVFCFSGELPAPILRNWVETNMIGRDNITMQDGHVRILNSEQRKLMQNWYSGKVLVYDDGYNVTATALLNKMEELARKCGTKVFLIDNLMMVDLECNEEGRLQAEKEFVNKLIFFAKKYNVLVFLVAHPRKTGEIRVTKEDIAGSGNIVNLAHMVFSVHRYTDREKEGETNTKNQFIKGKEPIPFDSCIEVLKNRITGILPLVNLYFDYPSYRFYQTPNELWLRYGWNKDNSPIRTDDPNPHAVAVKEVSPFDE
jgi:TOPRIM domain protein|nr:MAG TPA: DNA directed DNA polymerase [Caudoviricetes sp.]